MEPTPKKLLFIIIDALTSRVLVPLLDEGKLPHFAALRDAGYFNDECVSIFPSITHACLATLATGHYPAQHGILGSHWYVAEQQELAYYGADPGVILNEGIGDFVEDFAVKLNQERLLSPTIFQQVEQNGRSAASLNFLIFHGDVKHTCNIPLLLKILPGVPSELTVYGPTSLWLGGMVQQTEPDLESQNIFAQPGNWFGFRDEDTAHLLIQLAEQRSFPDFTLAYFPRNDFISHEMGPDATSDNLIELDSYLGQLFTAYGSLDLLLEDMTLVLTADHSQSSVKENPNEASINLHELLEDLYPPELGRPFSDTDDLLVCPNMRAAQIYFKEPKPSMIRRAIDRLLPEKRVDQVMWRADLLGEGVGYTIASAPGTQLRFWRAGEGSRSETTAASDRYGNHWGWEGDLAVVDGHLQSGILTFPDYPNAFERIAGILDSRDSGHLWLSAGSGYEFNMPKVKLHIGGGSHGSLHRLDSIVPLFVAGAPDTASLPKHPRIVDVTPLCLDILGIKKLCT